jgi:hypothetical protein
MTRGVRVTRRDQDGRTPADNRAELAPADHCDPVIEAYKKDVDRTLRART